MQVGQSERRAMRGDLHVLRRYLVRCEASPEQMAIVVSLPGESCTRSAGFAAEQNHELGPIEVLRIKPPNHAMCDIKECECKSCHHDIIQRNWYGRTIDGIEEISSQVLEGHQAFILEALSHKLRAHAACVVHHVRNL